MKKFLEEQETASQPPEPRGEKTPDEADVKSSEEESGKGLLGETIPEEADAQEEEQVEWDGSQAELVADDSAAGYEEQQTGIKLKYSLKSKEIFYALCKTQYTKLRIAMSAAAVLLSAAWAVVFFINRAKTGDGRTTISVALCIVLILMITVLPAARNRIKSRQLADENEVRMKIYPDHIQMGKGESQWEIPLDGTSERMVFQNMLILYIGGESMVILPLRCVEPAVLPEVQAMIFAGTQPKK